MIPDAEKSTLDGSEEERESRTAEDQDAEWPLTKDTTCGLGPIRGSFLQRFANNEVYVVICGITGAIFIGKMTYFYGTISTIEKRFKIPSKNIGYLSVGHEMVLTIMSLSVTYFAGKGHKPRWIAFGLLATALSSFLLSLPHILYGGGSSESFTLEHGDVASGIDNSDIYDLRKDLCNVDPSYAAKCDTDDGHLEPQVIFFIAQMIAGIGSALYSSLATTYMDDNARKDKTPYLITIMNFLGMTGPMLGFSIAGLCLKLFVTPSLTPTISNSDPRWVGAWWLGHIVLGLGLLVSAIVVGLFPKVMPHTARRRHQAMLQGNSDDDDDDVMPASWRDFVNTIKRLLTNKIYMLNNISTIFVIYGNEPYFIYTPKYIESLYQKTSTESNFYTGTIGFIFTSIGTVISGIVVTRYKPSARKIVMWNCFVTFLAVLSSAAYSQLSCSDNEMASKQMQVVCSTNCHCDFVQYAPVCGEDLKTYISACHAGCTERLEADGNSTKKIYANCSCIEGGTATDGACPVDCGQPFTIFLTILSVFRLVSAMGMASNFVLSMRCIEEQDKTISVGMSMAFHSILAFTPIPVIFGSLVDSTCDLWGKTCSTDGNCWLYNGQSLRYLLNFTTGFSNFVAFCICLVICYYVKNLVVFDQDNITNRKDDSPDESQKLETTNC
ncbi:hypothetical protein DMENIID0001_091900 [Sergentomyia squamirostris]